MNRSPCWSLEELDAWLRWRRLNERMRHVGNPHAFRWPAVMDRAENHLRRLLRALNPQQRRLLASSCMAAGLARREEAPAGFLSMLERMIGPSELGIDLDWELVKDLRWAIAPIILAAGGHGDVMWALVGVADSRIPAALPSWWKDVGDEAARGGVVSAFKVFFSRTAKRICFLPLAPRIDRTLIHGPSLSLAVYLAAWGVFTGKNQDRLIATGGMDELGNLLPVGSIGRKADTARGFGFRAILFPAGSVTDEPTSQPIPYLPVTDLEAAEYFWENLDGRRVDDMKRDLSRIHDPKDLAAGIHLLDPRMRGWSSFGKAYENTLVHILRNPDDADIFAHRIERMLRDPDTDPHWVMRLLRPLNETRFRELAAAAPLTAFRSAQACWTAATQLGDLDSAVFWRQRCMDLRTPLERYPRGLEHWCDFVNRRLITEHHGRYRFSPQLPRDVLEILAALEKRRTDHGRGAAVPASPALGKLHGTIAQNYGYCGPDYWDETRREAKCAQEAFGAGEIPDYAEDWLRQFNYLSYAALDARLFGEATEALRTYITCEPGGDDVCKLKLHRYQHAAVARYLADTKTVNRPYEYWCRAHIERIKPGHPWQLWLLNVGRFFERKGDKRKAWSMGMEFCLKLGETARPMALLHAAQLWKESLARGRDLEKPVMSVLDEIDRGSLNRDHFSALLSSRDWKTVLDVVLHDAPRLFPFTYR